MYIYTVITYLLHARVGAAAQQLRRARHLPVVEPLQELVQQRLGAVAVYRGCVGAFSII